MICEVQAKRRDEESRTWLVVTQDSEALKLVAVRDVWLTLSGRRSRTVNIHERWRAADGLSSDESRLMASLHRWLVIEAENLEMLLDAMHLTR